MQRAADAERDAGAWRPLPGVRRAGQVIRESGYDGEYGVIRLFEEGELKRLTGGGLLFDAPVAKRKEKAPAPIVNKEPPFIPPPPARERSAPPQAPGLLAELDD